MRRLRLIGLSADGRDVVFVDEANNECAAPADDRLRAALRGDRARLGQLEIEMDSVLRPRDIQARIRAGQTPESVAALAQVSVDKIMPYCVPVLAEREHVASQAGRGFVRRPNVDSGGARKLSEVVAEKLRDRGLDPATAEWDAWRRDDGRWSVQARYQSGGAEHHATFLYDAVGRYSVADDDEAKWFTGERQATRKGPQPREAAPRTADDAETQDDETTPVARRLSAVPAGEDLLSLTLEVEVEAEDLADAPAAADEVFDQEADAPVDESEQGSEADAEPAAPRGFIESVMVPDEPVDTSDDLTAMVRAIRESMAEEHAAAEAVQSEPEPAQADGREDKQRRRNGKRASVPSWDEIMFGRSGADR